MDDKGFFGVLNEALKAPIYSKKEAALERGKDLSTTSKPKEVEHDYIDYDPFTSYTSNALMDQSQGQANRRDMIGKWRRTAWYPEVDEAINEIVGEAIVFDEQEQVIELNTDDIETSDKISKKIQDSFDKIMFLLDFNRRGEDLFKQWYVDGMLNLEVVYDNNKITDGIKQLLPLAPYDIWKLRDTTSGRVYYIMKDKPTFDQTLDIKDAERVFLDEQMTQITSGLWSTDKKTPMSYINKAMKTINQLYLLEDSVVIWHITRSPEKRVFYIDTGNLPKGKAEEYIKRLIAKYRQKKIYNAETGDIENRSKSISILEDFWLPRNAQGRGTQIDTLSAQAPGMNEMGHIDYFVDKVYRALNIPSTRRKGLSQDSPRLSIGNSLDIEQDELRFFRFILKLRRRFNDLFVDLLKKDLLATRVFTIQEWNKIQEKIKFKYANNNAFSEIKKLQILEMRMGVAGNATSMVDDGYFSMEYIKRDILQQSDEDIERITKQREDEIKSGEIPDPAADPEGEDDNFRSGQVEPGAPTMGNFGTMAQSKHKPDYGFATKAAKTQAKRKGKSTKGKGKLLMSSEDLMAKLIDRLPELISEIVEESEEGEDD
jgi:hypothetical protein